MKKDRRPGINQGAAQSKTKMNILHNFLNEG